MSNKISAIDIEKITKRYIGVRNGYLGDFSYASHKEFYPLYCNLSIDPNDFPGTTRERFVYILQNESPINQSKIIKGVLDRFPLTAEDKPNSRTENLAKELEDLASSLSNNIVLQELHISSSAVRQAIQDIAILLQADRPESCVDRIHTLIHAYLLTVCKEEGIEISDGETFTKVFKIIRSNHPAFLSQVPQQKEIDKVMNSIASILDALNPVRNNASEAHPTNQLIKKPEATLIINAGITIMNYLDAKLESWNTEF